MFASTITSASCLRTTTRWVWCGRVLPTYLPRHRPCLQQQSRVSRSTRKIQSGLLGGRKNHDLRGASRGLPSGYDRHPRNRAEDKLWLWRHCCRFQRAVWLYRLASILMGQSMCWWVNFRLKKNPRKDFFTDILLFSVEAQKDYHRIRGNLLPDDNDRTTKPMKGGGGRGGFGYTPVYTEPPPIKTLPPSPDPPKWTQPPINPWTQPPPDPYTEAQPDPWDPGRWPTTSDREFGEYLKFDKC